MTISDLLGIEHPIVQGGMQGVGIDDFKRFGEDFAPPAHSASTLGALVTFAVWNLRMSAGSTWLLFRS